MLSVAEVNRFTDPPSFTFSNYLQVDFAVPEESVQLACMWPPLNLEGSRTDVDQMERALSHVDGNADGRSYADALMADGRAPLNTNVFGGDPSLCLPPPKGSTIGLLEAVPGWDLSDTSGKTVLPIHVHVMAGAHSRLEPPPPTRTTGARHTLSTHKR